MRAARAQAALLQTLCIIAHAYAQARVSVVSTAQELAAATSSGAAHIRVVEHIDLSSLPGGTPAIYGDEAQGSGWKLLPGPQLKSLVVHFTACGQRPQQRLQVPYCSLRSLQSSCF